MTIPTALILAGVLWAAAGAAFVAFGLWQMHRDNRDRHPGADVAYGDELRRMRQALEERRRDMLAPVAAVFSQQWQAKRARFAAYIADFPAALLARADQIDRTEGTPTAEYKAVVARNFGVRLDEVGPRELDCTRTEGWTQPTFEFGVVTR
ncbi:MAG TPA: hypothetical protein VFY84_02995 [Jiangellales bacterium]|nr:hypothetical protein [Jiangellales bacterium]